jgi:hypothetical protein
VDKVYARRSPAGRPHEVRRRVYNFGMPQSALIRDISRAAIEAQEGL